VYRLIHSKGENIVGTSERTGVGRAAAPTKDEILFSFISWAGGG
jgi:hypothetical protein